MKKKSVVWVKCAQNYRTNLLSVPIPKNAVYGRYFSLYFFITDFKQFRHEGGIIRIQVCKPPKGALQLPDYKGSFRELTIAPKLSIKGKIVENDLYNFIFSHVLALASTETQVENILLLKKSGVLPATYPKSNWSHLKHMAPCESPCQEHEFVADNGQKLYIYGKDYNGQCAVKHEGVMYFTTGKSYTLNNSRKKNFNDSFIGTDKVIWDATGKTTATVSHKRPKTNKPEWTKPQKDETKKLVIKKYTDGYSPSKREA